MDATKDGYYLVRDADELGVLYRFGRSWFAPAQSMPCSHDPDEILDGPLDLDEMCREAQAKRGIGEYMAGQKPRVARDVPG